MVDNVAITPGSGAIVSADDIGGVLFQRVKVTWGPDGTANDADTASGKPLPIQDLTPRGHSATATFTCGTTAYAINDAVGASGGAAALSFTSVGLSGKQIDLRRVELEIDTTALISGEGNYRLYFYNVTPPSASNDSAAWDLPSGDRASFLGFVDIGVPVDLGSTLYVDVDLCKRFQLSGTGLFAYLVTTTAYTPTARVFKVTVHTEDL